MSRSETGGLLLVDKPEGPTSHDVVEAVRRALGGTRCGHAGTLDPFASGLLVIGTGKATRLLRFLSGADKSYEGTIRLGTATDTDDRTGRPLHDPRPADFTEDDLARALASQSGGFDQLPPGFSARKQGGIPSYRLARRGQEPPRTPSRVRVSWDECRREEPGLLRIRLTVSAGTYIRAIARDLGDALGCGAHLETLRRTGSGLFRIADAVRLPEPFSALRRPRRGPASGGPSEVNPEEAAIAAESLRGLADTLQAALIPPEAIPLDLPSETLSEDEARRIRTGGVVSRNGAGAAPGAGTGFVRLLGKGGDLVAIAEADPTGDGRLLRPRIVL